MLYKTHLEIGENTLNTIEGRGRNLIDKKKIFLKEMFFQIFHLNIG